MSEFILTDKAVQHQVATNQLLDNSDFSKIKNIAPSTTLLVYAVRFERISL